MFFSKKNADNNYFALKDKVLKNFEMYQHFPTYEDPHVIRDKWSEELEDAKSVYKLSKKYVDTEVICTLFTGQPVRRVFLCVIVMSLK